MVTLQLNFIDLILNSQILSLIFSECFWKERSAKTMFVATVYSRSGLLCIIYTIEGKELLPHGV